MAKAELTFPEAIAFIAQLEVSGLSEDLILDEDGRLWPFYEQAERCILGHRPQSPAEAVAILDLLLDQKGERSDNLDAEALQAIRDFLAGNS
jgi:hypothetical protein